MSVAVSQLPEKVRAATLMVSALAVPTKVRVWTELPESMAETSQEPTWAALNVPVESALYLAKTSCSMLVMDAVPVMSSLSRS